MYPLFDRKWDFRVDGDSVANYFYFPQYHKKNILNKDEQKPRDWLLNLYFAKPDYEEVHKKLFYTTFMGIKLGVFSGMFAAGAGNTRSLRYALNAAGKHLAFATGGAMLYGATAATVANMRQKSDIWNHFVAGASLGFINGYYTKSSGYGAFVGAFCAIAAVGMKAFHDSGMEFFTFRTRDFAFSDGNQFLDIKFENKHLQQFKREPRLQ